MRHAYIIVCLVMAILVVAPTSAQLRTDAASMDAPTRLYDTGGTGLSLNSLFSPQHFKMAHSFEMSSGGFGGTMAMYTNSMMWEFSSKLAARLDLAVAKTPMGDLPGMSATGQNNMKFFVRNAEIAYRPKENMLLHLSVRQSPYGRYMSPYGAYRPYGNSYGMSFGQGAGGGLYWNQEVR